MSAELPVKKTGLLVSVYKTNRLSDCTNGGLTSKFDQFILTGEGIKGPFEPSERTPELKLVRRNIYGKEYIHAEPVDRPDSGNVGYMAGGNFIYTSDSRFPTYPVSVHDRQETQSQYDQLSY